MAQAGYEPWGESPSPAAGPALFNGRPFDSAMGLYDFGARVYAPQLGRFLSADTVWSRSDPQGANAYAFVLNNPLKHTDPDGHVPVVVITGGIGGLIGGAAAAYQYRHLDGWEYAAEVSLGALSGALMGAGLHGTVAPAYTLRFLADRVIGTVMIGQGAAIAGDQAGRHYYAKKDAPYVDSKALTKEVLGTSRSSAPDGGAPVKGVQGGKPVSPSPLSATPDGGTPSREEGLQLSRQRLPAEMVSRRPIRQMDSGIVRVPAVGPNAELIP